VKVSATKAANKLSHLIDEQISSEGLRYAPTEVRVYSEDECD
jgi:hypothetical protein